MIDKDIVFERNTVSIFQESRCKGQAYPNRASVPSGGSNSVPPTSQPVATGPAVEPVTAPVQTPVTPPPVQVPVIPPPVQVPVTTPVQVPVTTPVNEPETFAPADDDDPTYPDDGFVVDGSVDGSGTGTIE